MIGTYASAALICAASLLVGRAVLSLAGRRSWSWLEPGVGLAAVLAVTGVLARAPGHGTSVTLGVVALLVVAALVVWRLPYEAPGALRAGLPVAIVVAGRAVDPVRGQRSLGPARRRLQQRPRPAPGLGRVAAQRLRAGAGPRLPAGPARAGGGDGGAAGDRAGAGLRRRDRRDRRPHRADRARRPARAGARGGGCWPRRWSPSPTSPPPTSPRPPSRRPPRPSSSSPSPSS